MANYVCGVVLILAAGTAAAQCVDYSKDPAGCQPSTFDTPIGQMPSVRVNRDGKVDPTSSEEEARAGVAKLEKELHLFRNIEPLHWVLTVPSVKDSATGAWKGGDLDAAGDGRGLGIAGNCIFTGHQNGAGKKHAINIFKIQPDPVKQPPVQVNGKTAAALRQETPPFARVARVEPNLPQQIFIVHLGTPAQEVGRAGDPSDGESFFDLVAKSGAAAEIPIGQRRRFAAERLVHEAREAGRSRRRAVLSPDGTGHREPQRTGHGDCAQRAPGSPISIFFVR